MSSLYTQDLDELFFLRLSNCASALGCDPEHLMSVMMSESGIKADAKNPSFDANGLIQFMGQTLKNLGYLEPSSEFRKLSAAQQIPYVQRYFSAYRGRLKSAVACYVATFLPALVDHANDPDFVLSAKSGFLGWAYSPNAVFDANHDLKITVGELSQAIERNCRGNRWNEAVARLHEREYADADTADTVVEMPDLGTTRGLQLALYRVGFDPGAIDGLPGPRTSAAVLAFQSANGLKADGIYGPLTRKCLQAKLTSVG